MPQKQQTPPSHIHSQHYAGMPLHVSHGYTGQSLLISYSDMVSKRASGVNDWKHPPTLTHPPHDVRTT